MRLHLRMSDDLDEDAAVTPVVARHAPNGDGKPVEHVHVEAEAMFRTAYAARSDPRRRHVSLSVPAVEPPGLYTLELPGRSSLTCWIPTRRRSRFTRQRDFGCKAPAQRTTSAWQTT